ncbi:hypothetical protein JCM21714_2201 [Gracilibacillus boraciitolerans JCM 21714]|uniref:Uncharacterized protein n=1 Tax=Gracilibacillus boraciitolerans JCM 21714 TaxID=1298598 RepID=W4VJ25_9BACI|nr:hypothetical protein JCM21714_2201 [Gracilibacillus boraciitolerans JCM 21714]
MILQEFIQINHVLFLLYLYHTPPIWYICQEEAPLPIELSRSLSPFGIVDFE